MPFKKPSSNISGVIAGVLLFLALFAVQLNSAFFSSAFQKTAIDRLSVYDRLIAPPDRSSANSGSLSFEATIRNSITPDLFNKNVKSLIDGLIDFISGHTDNLPDLYIPGSDQLSITASAGVTPAAVEKINLQLVMMFSNEQNYTDILSVISLIQFILSYLPAFSTLLYAAIIAAILLKGSSDMLIWLRTSTISFFVLCWLAAGLISLTPFFSPLPRILDPNVAAVLADYVRYCSGGIARETLLSGLIALAGMETVFYLYRRFSGRSNVRFYGRLSRRSYGRFDTVSLTNSSESCELSTPHHKVKTSFHKVGTILFVYSLLTFVLVGNTYRQFHKRNLGHTISYIMGTISYNRYTDARNEDVCLLNIKVLNENDKKPFENLQTAIFPLDVNVDDKVTRNKEVVPGKTDKHGAASFLLTKGEFRLELNASGLSEYEGPAIPAPAPIPVSVPVPVTLLYDFSLTTPGRTELVITLGSDPGTSNDTSASSTISALSIPRLKIIDASMQYIP